uniref:Uncharacterized protein n=1 Tax=Enterobacter asburiae TaxID=61645 RepID=A0A455VXN0_ENTAS|nr:hypothetical protein MRY18106EAS_12970 [Enterobacter asburiae]
MSILIINHDYILYDKRRALYSPGREGNPFPTRDPTISKAS